MLWFLYIAKTVVDKTVEFYDFVHFIFEKLAHEICGGIRAWTKTEQIHSWHAQFQKNIYVIELFACFLQRNHRNIRP